MEQYQNKQNSKIANIINHIAAGMCQKTIGMTMVIYKYEGDTYNYPFIMEHQEFYEKHLKITK